MSAQLQPDVAHVDTVQGVSATEYHVTGSLPAVQTFIAATFRKWHPLGYGTRVHSIEMQMNGIYAARMSRANSCN